MCNCTRQVLEGTSRCKQKPTISPLFVYIFNAQSYDYVLMPRAFRFDLFGVRCVVFFRSYLVVAALFFLPAKQRERDIIYLCFTPDWTSTRLKAAKVNGWIDSTSTTFCELCNKFSLQLRPLCVFFFFPLPCSALQPPAGVREQLLQVSSHNMFPANVWRKKHPSLTRNIHCMPIFHGFFQLPLSSRIKRVENISQV